MPTEVFLPDCESAYLYQTRGALAGRRIRLREARADFDGHIAELLSKALPQAQLDQHQPLTAEDRDRLLCLHDPITSAESSAEGPVTTGAVDHFRGEVTTPRAR